MYHLLCWAYVTGDLVSCVRCKKKWEDDLLPLCPWYLRAFCDPASLGKDERAVKPDPKGRLHHCYGHTIEADYGYVYVSLSTMYIPVGVSDENKLKVRGSNEPMHLLTNFVIPEMDVKDIQKQDEEEEAVKEEDEDDKKRTKNRPN